MSDLYPTPTRIELLRDVVLRRVVFYPASGGFPDESKARVPGGRPRTVTKRCAEMERAGWIRHDDERFAASAWELTDKGREILAGAS